MHAPNTISLEKLVRLIGTPLWWSLGSATIHCCFRHRRV